MIAIIIKFFVIYLALRAIGKILFSKSSKISQDQYQNQFSKKMKEKDVFEADYEVISKDN